VGQRWRSFKKIVRLWVDLFDRHSLLTYASAIALRAFIAAVACTLFGLGILGASHQQELWKKTIGPQIEPKVLPHVFDGIDQTVHRVFSSSTAGLLALAAALAVWEVSGIVRAGIGALNEIYETPEPRPFWIRFPLSWGLAILFLAAVLGAIAIVWIGHTPGGWGTAIWILRWPAAMALIAFAFELIVRWAPAQHRRVRWASLGSVGQYVVNTNPTFDSRNYGYSKLSDLVRDVPRLEVREVPTGNGLVTLHVRRAPGGRSRR